MTQANEQKLIATQNLSLSDIPKANADFYSEIEPFCLTIDGYEGGRRPIDDCFEIAEVVDANMSGSSIEAIRIAAFIWQRRIRNNDQSDPDPAEIAKVRVYIDEIRRRFEGAST